MRIADCGLRRAAPAAGALRIAVVVLGACLLSGCKQIESLLGGGTAPTTQPAEAAGGRDGFRLQPLAVQQAEAYPETCTGLFVALADFEDVPEAERGFAQVGRFSIRPAGLGGERKFVVNVTRTGVGALEATVPPAAELVLTLPHFRDFTQYKLLSMAVFSRSVRDDLRVRLTDENGAEWTSSRKLIRTGWNTVLLDIRRLADAAGFDATSVRTLGIGFPDAAGPVWFNVDDVLLVDNERTIQPTPAGVVLRKAGLNYFLTLPGQGAAIALRQHDDGLWRFDRLGPEVRMAGIGEDLPASGEHLELMGPRRIGQVEVLEHNRIRLRLANTWYFPRRAGQWPSLAVRTIRWEHTFYGDGRWIAEGTLNNAGGQEISSVGVYLPVPAVWSGGRESDHFILSEFVGEVGRWRRLIPPNGPARDLIVRNCRQPGRVEPTLAAPGAFAPGDPGRDGFDESTGCFYLAAKAGHCRFTVVPPPGGLWNPVFLVSGGWDGVPSASSEGLPIRTAVRRADGSMLFLLPGRLSRPTSIEVTGR